MCKVFCFHRAFPRIRSGVRRHCVSWAVLPIALLSPLFRPLALPVAPPSVSDVDGVGVGWCAEQSSQGMKVVYQIRSKVGPRTWVTTPCLSRSGLQPDSVRCSECIGLTSFVRLRQSISRHRAIYYLYETDTILLQILPYHTHKSLPTKNAKKLNLRLLPLRFFGPQA